MDKKLKQYLSIYYMYSEGMKIPSEFNIIHFSGVTTGVDGDLLNTDNKDEDLR